MSDTPVAGYVYLIHEDGDYKIGHSVNPLARLREVGRAGAALVHVIPSAWPDRIESELHARFDAVRGDGEWFALAAVDVVRIQSVTHADTVEDLPPDLRTPAGFIPRSRRRTRTGKHKATLVTHLERDLDECLEAYRESLPHDPGRSQIVRDTLRDFLRARGFYPPKKPTQRN